MSKIFLAIASTLAGLAVAGGAFASHALKEKISTRALEIFETGIKYQMYHALALLVIVVLLTQEGLSPNLLNKAGISFIIGIILFSGSLYALSLSSIKWLGIITPFGGFAFLCGWLLLLLSAIKWQ
jgi:uncharacterized membrane protein YgdD (TMEM256/DUF423 family)